jgi:protein CsiD
MSISIVLAILVTSIATFSSRFLGVVSSEGIKETSKLFRWFNCLAYSTLAALIARTIIFPVGVLSEASYLSRLAVVLFCLFYIFYLEKKFCLSNSNFCYHDGIIKRVLIMEKISGLTISEHNNSKRIINIEIENEIIEKLIFPFNKFDLTALELKPFTRFTIAKSLDDLTDNKLSKLINSIIRDRSTGCFIIGPRNITSKINDNFLVKLSTAIAHLIGIPNHDSMAGKYYARFTVKHEDQSDSYLRKAYRNMDLHTDGTYVKEVTDWLLMTKINEQNVEGGETAMLHLDDWEHCDDLSNDPVGKQNFIWGSPKSKNIDYKVEHPVFSSDENGKPNISYIDQFPEPKNMEQGNFLQRLSDALEESENKTITKLPVGSAIIANNYFWLHGRKPFKENKELNRELLRIRGSFFIN